MLQKLSVIIPTKNEVHNIEAVIASVNFADEIIVIDSYSNDGTFEMAQKLATRVLQREFDYHAAQKNWGIPQAKYEWILLVDADERLTSELRTEILEFLNAPPNLDYDGYWIKRINHFMGQRVNYSGWRNDSVIRLFKRDSCKYENINVHEEIISTGKIGHLKHKLEHYTYRSMDAYLAKMNRYATQQAKDYDQKTGIITPYHYIIKPSWGFFKHYIIQSGFRDGFVGLTIGYVQAYVIFMRYVKLWLLRRNRI